MSIDDLFEPFGWILYLLVHCIADITNSDDIGVCFILLLALHGALLGVESRLIEIQIFTHGDALSGDEQLEQGRYFSIPVLTGLASPCTQQRETNFTTSI